MATAKIVTWSRPDKDGQFPIGIKIWNNGKPSYIFDGHTLPSRDLWAAKKQEVKKSVPHAARLTNLLTKKLSEVRDKALQLETEKPKIAAGSIKNSVQGKDEEQKFLTFVEIANQYLEDQLSCGNYDVHKTDKGRLKRFYEFANNGKIAFQDITVELLQRYTIFLRKAKKVRYNEHSPIKPLSERTITNHLLIIRTLYNRAITAKVASKDDYPFGADGKIAIKFPKSSKIGLTEKEIRNLEELDLSNHVPIYNHARNIWLTEFYFAGMRVTDCLLLKWGDFQDNRLYYQMSKNSEHGSLKIPQKVITILNQYREEQNDTVDNKHNLVFPFLKELATLDDRLMLRRKICHTVKSLNTAMEKIMLMVGSNKNASQHKARHSFAQLAEEKNVHPKVLQKMYRHESILTTMNYQSNFSHKKADEALEAVLGF